MEGSKSRMQGKVSPEHSADARVYVGIDVCKAWLDVYLHPVGRKLRLSNNLLGFRALQKELKPHSVALIVLEATGKYHRAARRTLHAAGLVVAVVNPLRSRLFAEAMGALAKTDAVDARLLAIFGESLEPTAVAPTSEALEELQELVQARSAAIAEASALSNRAGESRTRFLKAELKRRLNSLKLHIARLDAEIRGRINSDEGLARRHLILASIPSFGPVVAATLVALMSELGRISNKAAALLAGLAPIAHDSGETTGARHIRGGRAHVRCVLYMAAVAATRCNPDLAAFYKRLRDAGKKTKVALTAVMRKLILLANTLIREDRLWETAHA
jgi:transposase